MALDLNAALNQYGFVGTLANSIPDLKAIFDQAAREEWQPERFQRAVQDSGWWKSNADSVRQLATLQATDPATYNQNLANAVSKIQLISGQMGRSVDPHAVALQALMGNWDDEQIRSFVGAGGGLPTNEGRPDALAGDAGQLLDHMAQLTTDYGIPYSQTWLNSWVTQVQAGRDTLDGFEALVKARAKASFPQFADQINAGMTVRDIADPWMATMANTLEMSSSQIKLTDPTIQKALTQRNPDGTATSMPLWQFERQLKDDPRWDATKQARDAAYSTVAQIGKDFGFVGGGS